MTTGRTMSMLDEKPLLFLVDGHALVHRAWHAIQQPLNVSGTGEEVRAVYGFLNALLKAVNDWRPTHCAIAFDVAAPTFRHRQYEEYKAHRPPTPPELRGQFDRIRQVMGVFRIPIYEVEGYEADDVLGTLSRQAEEHEIEALILTGDTDTLQLVSPWVRVLLTYSAQKRTVYDEAAVRERYGGLGPDALPDIKGLQGDPSDNIPGVPGVGGKTAVRLLSEFGSVAGIYESIDRVTPARVQQALRDHREQAVQGKELATIVREVPVQLDLEASQFGRYERSEVVGLLRELEFFSIVANVPEPPYVPSEAVAAAAAEAPERRCEVVSSEEGLDALVKELASSSRFAFDTAATSEDPMSASLVGLAFAAESGLGWYVPVGHGDGVQLDADLVLARLSAVFEDEGIGKTAHNANFGVALLANAGVNVRNLDFDAMLAAHLVGRKSIGLQALALDCLREELAPLSDLVGTGKKRITMAQVDVDRAAEYATANAGAVHGLRDVLAEELDRKKVRRLFDELEMPLAPVLVSMSRKGVTLDTGLLHEMSVELGEKLTRIEEGMRDLVGHEFNLNSSRQLGDVLFKELKLPHTKRTQTGYSTDASSLEGLKHVLDQGEAEGVDPRAYEVLDRILEYRQLSKIKSTYVDALPTLVNPKTGRVHTRYNQTGSATGRISSNDPNVQNIPVRTELGRRVRSAFIAQNAPEWTLLAADYSQIELRILAHLSQDPGLLDAFRNNEDIHSSTAASVYGVPIGEVTPEMRRIAKIMNFGVIYGLSAYGISQQTDLAPDEGAQFIETYFGKYPGIRSYIDSIKAQVRDAGYVQTILQRRRYIHEIRSSNRNVRAAGERMAVNMPIQGTAADIVKIAMLRIQALLDQEEMRSMMIVQVHDELIFETPQDELERLKSIVEELMPSAMTLAAPLEVEIKTGYTWGDMDPV